jgi:hypothetical protein
MSYELQLSLGVQLYPKRGQLIDRRLQKEEEQFVLTQTVAYLHTSQDHFNQQEQAHATDPQNFCCIESKHMMIKEHKRKARYNYFLIS